MFLNRRSDTEGNSTETIEKEKRTEIQEASYKKELTMIIDLEGPEKVTILLKVIRLLCGVIFGCRPLGLTSL